MATWRKIISWGALAFLMAIVIFSIGYYYYNQQKAKYIDNKLKGQDRTESDVTILDSDFADLDEMELQNLDEENLETVEVGYESE